jgi:hypothetical protein
MDKIIIKKQEGKSKVRRATVVVKPETYKRINDISVETNQPIETITNILLEAALENVEIK